MRRYFNYEHKARGAYILTALEKYLRNGDAYFASEADAFRICQRKYQNVSLSKLKADFDYLLENGDLVFEGSRLYLHKVQRYSYGSWIRADDTQHKRTKTCSVCKASSEEYADHVDANGDGKCDDCGATVSLTITWDAGTNGGTIDGKATYSETVQPNSKPTIPASLPVKKGHSFKGWYTAKTGGKLCSTVTSITASTTFYAQFEANKYVVTWDLGTGKTETTNQTYGEKLVLPTEPTRKNAEFLGWFTEANGGTINGKAAYSETVQPNSKPTIPASLPVKKGHSFKGWYTAKTGGKLYNTVTSITTSTTFYAQFEANQYVVTWDLGTGKTETTNQPYGEKLVLPTEPTRKNAEFLGWFTEASGGTQVDSNTIYITDGETTYYAHWEITELFSVTVPATLPLVVDESGKVYVAAASIVNNSTGDVKVSSVSVTSKNGWEFVPYSTNMAKAKVDAKQVGFKINSSETSKTGDSEVFTLAAPWTVKEADVLSINYDAVVSAVSQPVTGQEIMSVVFVLEWA